MKINEKSSTGRTIYYDYFLNNIFCILALITSNKSACK